MATLEHDVDVRRPLSDGPADGPAAARADRTAARSWRAVAPVLVLALLGLLVGGLLGAVRTVQPTAVASLLVTPDPALPGETAGSSTDEADRFVQGQVLVLSGEDLRVDVARRLGMATPPQVQAVQVGGTDIVRVSVAAGSGETARRAAAQVLTSYQEQRTARFRTRVDALQSTVQRQLDSTSRAVGAAGGSEALRPALTSEYTRLVALLNQIQLAQPGDQDTASVVEQPQLQRSSRLSVVVRGALGGLVLGAVLGALVLLVRRRTLPAGRA